VSSPTGTESGEEEKKPPPVEEKSDQELTNPFSMAFPSSSFSVGPPVNGPLPDPKKGGEEKLLDALKGFGSPTSSEGRVEPQHQQHQQQHPQQYAFSPPPTSPPLFPYSPPNVYPGIVYHHIATPGLAFPPPTSQAFPSPYPSLPVNPAPSTGLSLSRGSSAGDTSADQTTRSGLDLPQPHHPLSQPATGATAGNLGVNLAYLATAGVGLIPPKVSSGLSVGGLGGPGGPATGSTSSSTGGGIPGEELRRWGLGLLGILHDRLLSHLIQRLVIDGPSAFFPLLLTSKAMYQFANWEKIWRKIVLTMSAGDFYYEWSWKYTARKIKERKEREFRELSSSSFASTIPHTGRTSSSDTDIGEAHSQHSENDSNGDDDDEESDSSLEFLSVSSPVRAKSAVAHASTPASTPSGLGVMPTHGIATQMYPTMHVTGFYSEYMYRKWYRRQAELSTFVHDTGHVPRVSRLTEPDFVVNYDKPNRPCIITDVVTTWPAFQLWQADSLALRFPDMMVKISQLTPVRTRVKMTMMEYLTYMRRTKDPKPLYAFDSKVITRVPILRSEFKIPKYFRQDYFSILGTKRPMYRWLVIGPAHTGTSFHTDPNGTSAWNALIQGHKRWAIYPPHHTPPGLKSVLLDENKVPQDYSAFSPLRWYYEIYPYLKPHEKPIEFVQGPGEMVFIPSGWWHQVINLDETVSYTQNFVNDNNLNQATISLYKTPKRKLLRFWIERLYESHPAIFRLVKQKIHAIKGAETRIKYKKLKTKYKDRKIAWAGEKEALNQQLLSLHKSRDFRLRGSKTHNIPSLQIREHGITLSMEALGVGPPVTPTTPSSAGGLRKAASVGLSLPSSGSLSAGGELKKAASVGFPLPTSSSLGGPSPAGKSVSVGLAMPPGSGDASSEGEPVRKALSVGLSMPGSVGTSEATSTSIESEPVARAFSGGLSMPAASGSGESAATSAVGGYVSPLHNLTSTQSPAGGASQGLSLPGGESIPVTAPATTPAAAPAAGASPSSTTPAATNSLFLSSDPLVDTEESGTNVVLEKSPPLESEELHPDTQ